MVAALRGLLSFGKPRKAQLDIVDIFNVVDALHQRGFSGVTESQPESTLLSILPGCAPNFADFAARSAAKAFLASLTDKEFRKTIRGIVFGTSRATDQQYTFEASEDNQQRYSRTIELLMAYLCIDHLRAWSAGFGIMLDGTPAGGDFDCISNFQNALFSFEVKSGQARNISLDELTSFLMRHDFLNPEASILFIDYDGIPSSIVAQCKGLLVRPGFVISDIYQVTGDGCVFYALDANVLVVDIGNSGNMLSVLRQAIRFLYRYKAKNHCINFGLLTPDAIGYPYVAL